MTVHKTAAFRPLLLVVDDEVSVLKVIETLRQVHGNRMAAAKVLGIRRRALYRRLERHYILDETPRRSAGRSLR